MMSLWNYYRTRFFLLREAYQQLNDQHYERNDYGEECCNEGTGDSQVLLIGLLILITALAAYLLLAASVSSGRRKRELIALTETDSRQLEQLNGKWATIYSCLFL